jgi:hypothetical protein
MPRLRAVEQIQLVIVFVLSAHGEKNPTTVP